ncbi:MAG: VOC family protein [Blastocatellales bacterium]
MPRVVHFEIHAENPDRAIEFYKSLFGWEFTKWEGDWPYWLIKTGEDSEPGINGGMIIRQGGIDGTSVIAYVCTVNVPDLDKSFETALARGGQVALPKMAVPGVGWLAYVKDTEGNILGMMQNDPNAK